MQSNESIQLPADYWAQIVIPDRNDFVKNVASHRHAFHYAVSLFHMADWIYVTHQETISGAIFNEPHTQIENEVDLANLLARHIPEFAVIRRTANTAKHLKLRKPNTDPIELNSAGQLKSLTSGWRKGPWTDQPYRSRASIVVMSIDERTYVEFDKVAAKVFDMWKELSVQHNWEF